MNLTDVLKKKLQQKNGSIASSFENMQNKLGSTQLPNATPATGANPTFVEALRNAAGNASTVQTTPTPSSPSVSLPKFTAPTYKDILDTRISTQNGALVQNVPNVNAGALNVGGAVSDVKGNQITTGEGVTPTYTDILNSAAGEGNLGISNESEGELQQKKDNEEKVETKVEPMTFEEYILSVKSKADDQYKRDIIDAQNTYDHSRSAYGNQAAALGNMGLTGSGYSDYLDSKAYGQMQADKNTAATRRDTTKYEADVKYADYLDQQESNKTSLFNSLYYNAGSLSNADIDNLAAINGFTPEQVTMLKAARLERIKTALDSTDYEKKDLDSLFDVSIPEEKALYDTYYSKLANNTPTVNFLDENDKLMSESDSITELNKVKAALGEDSEAYKTLKAKYDEMYNVTTKGVTYTGKEIGNRLRAETVGDNFEVEIVKDEKRTKYNVQNGGKVEADDADSAVLAFVTSGKVKDGEVFAWNGALYLRTGTDIIRVEQRDLTYAGQYNALKEVFGLK